MTHLRQTLIAAACAGLSATALAHEGHGAPAAHLHAADTLGLLMLALVAGLGAWLWLRGRR